MSSIRQDSTVSRVQIRSLALEKLEERLLLSGATMYVDDDFTSGTPGWGVDHFAQIQDGINAAGTDDTVMVAAGTYAENITVNSAHNGLTLQGEGAAVTIIDGGGSGTVVHLNNFDGGVLSGFTIRNGSAGDGGGINCESSDSTITSNIITGNAADLNGGGVYVDGGSPTIINNVLTDNTAYFGAAFYMNAASPTFANNTIYNNTAESCGGALYGAESVFTMVNSLLWNNYSNDLFPNHEIMLRSDSYLTIRYSIIMDGDDQIYAWMGADFSYDSTNSSSNPLFVAAASGDFHLQAGSPAIDAANGDAAPATDFSGNLRVDDPLEANSGVGTPAYADIGAFEFVGVLDNDAPTIASLQDSPDPVTRPGSVTLTALGVDDPNGAGTVAAVQFFRDANGNGTFEPDTDVLLGTDTNVADGWSWTGSTAGWPTGSPHTYFARARDNYSAYSDAVSTTGAVLNAAPTIGSLTDGLAGGSITLTAQSVHDDDTVSRVAFYLDANADGELQADTDTYLGDGLQNGANWGLAVDASGWADGTYTMFAQAQDNDSEWSVQAATQTTIGLREVGVIAGPAGVEVRVYDCDGTEDVSLGNVLVKFGKTGSVSSVSLSGTQAMGGLGLVIDGATSIGSIVDGRKGAKGAVAFIAADAPIKSIQLKSGMSGYNLNGLTLGGLIIPADVDSDGNVTDCTAIYSRGAASTVSLAGATAGDIWVGGAMKSFTMASGGYHGDMTARGSVGTISLVGDFDSSIRVLGSLSSMQLTGGDFSGTLDVTGNVSKLSVLAKTNKATGTSVGGTFRAGADVQVGGLLSSLNVSKHDTANGGEEFGLYSHQFSKITLGSLKLTAASLPYSDGDFCVELLA